MGMEGRVVKFRHCVMNMPLVREFITEWNIMK